jgi:hypothetical protein
MWRMNCKPHLNLVNAVPIALAQLMEKKTCAISISHGPRTRASEHAFAVLRGSRYGAFNPFWLLSSRLDLAQYRSVYISAEGGSAPFLLPMPSSSESAPVGLIERGIEPTGVTDMVRWIVSGFEVG